VANNINGTVWFAFLAGSAIGFNAAYPSPDLYSELTPEGQKAMAQLDTMCQEQGLLTYACKRIEDYTVGGVNPITEPKWRAVLNAAERKGPREINIEPQWASEAALDPNRMVRRGTGKESVEVLGYSPSARRVLLVWIYTTEHPPTGVWHGGSAIAAGRRIRAAYWRGRGDDRQD
jgi:hypothetical protein